MSQPTKVESQKSFQFERDIEIRERERSFDYKRNLSSKKKNLSSVIRRKVVGGVFQYAEH